MWKGSKLAKGGSSRKNAFKPNGYRPSGDSAHRTMCDGWQGDPYPTTHPYMGKNNATGAKYGKWMPHPYLSDMDTLTKRFGSWSGAHRLEVEPRVGVGNLRGERYRLGMTGIEHGQVLYPPVGLCNETSIHPTRHPRHVCKMDLLSEDNNCPFGINISKPNPDWPTVSRPGNPWYCNQRINPEHREGPPKMLKPHMPAAGIRTTHDCALAWRYHPANLSDPQLKRVIMQKTMGQFTDPSFGPRPGDILILQRPRKHFVRDEGFVQFYTANIACRKNLIWNHGDQIVRLGKLLSGRWKMNNEFKMFKLVQKASICSNEERWIITGLLARSPRVFIPLQTRKPYLLQGIVPDFWPNRGDLLIRADAINNPSQLEWAVVPVTGPHYRPGHGDVILRVCLERPSSHPYGKMAGSVEMFLYNGKGSGWVFMGRDEVVIDSHGQDLLEYKHKT